MKRSDFLKALGVSFLVPAIIKEEVLAEPKILESGIANSKSKPLFDHVNCRCGVLIIDDPNPGHGALYTDNVTGEQWVYIQQKGYTGQWISNIF